MREQGDVRFADLLGEERHPALDRDHRVESTGRVKDRHGPVKVQRNVVFVELGEHAAEPGLPGVCREVVQERRSSLELGCGQADPLRGISGSKDEERRRLQRVPVRARLVCAQL